jgi:hypothetical protein
MILSSLLHDPWLHHLSYLLGHILQFMVSSVVFVRRYIYVFLETEHEKQNTRMTEKYIAVRLKSIHHGEDRFSADACTIVNSRMEKREPALKNITDALFDLGVEYEIDSHALFWFLIDDDQAADEHQCYADIELAFEASWYDAEKARIRGYTGIHYYDACVELAKAFTLKDQTRLISDAKIDKVPEPEKEQEPVKDREPAKDPQPVQELQLDIEPQPSEEPEKAPVVKLPAKKRKPQAKRSKKQVKAELQLELF